MTTSIPTRAATHTDSADSDRLAQLIWMATHCDPDDPDPDSLWPTAPAAIRRRYHQIAESARTHIEQVEGWLRPGGWAPRRWESAILIPNSVQFRPIGDPREFIRCDDHARALPPANDGIRYTLGAMDAVFDRGYIEVRPS